MSFFSRAFKFVEHEAHNVVEDIDHEGKKIVKAVEKAAASCEKELKKLLDDVAIRLRGLSKQERMLLDNVYQSSLPPEGHLLVCNIIGMNGRPFTVPASFFEAIIGEVLPGIGPLLMLAAVELIGKRLDQYILFLGKKGYQDAINGFAGYGQPWGLVAPGEILVHEACHTWQGYHQAFTWSYVFNSVCNQCLHGSAAYNVPDNPTAQWKSFTAEQQAVLVQRWFHDGAVPTYDDPFYAYVASNVRPGNPHAETVFSQ